MSNLGDFNIDWNTVEEVSFEPLAEGDYAAKVTKSEIKDTKKKDKMLCLTFEILGEKGKNKKIFENYMLQHTNPKAVQVGLGRLKSLAKCLELDFDNLADTSELHGKPVGVKVKIEKSEQYGDKNQIAGFFDYSEDLLEASEGEEDISVEEPEDEMVEDIVEEVVQDEEVEEPVEEKSLSSKVSPAEIQGMKKDVLILFIKDNNLQVDMAGKKVSELKDEVIDVVFGTEVLEDEDVIIEG